MPYKRGQKWVGQVRRHGMRKEKVFQTKKEALEWEAEMRRKSERDWQRLTDTISLAEWAEEYLDYAKAKFTYDTYRLKRAIFKRFFTFVDPAMPVTRLTSKHILDYLRVQAETRSGYAANKERKNLLAAYNWGIKYLGLPTPNPCLVEKFPEERRPRYIPPEEDFWKAYDAARSQDKVMLLAYLHLAARRSELFRLRWEDVDFANQRVRLYTRKRKDGTWEYDWLPMTNDLFSALLKHKQSSKSEYVFVDPYTGEPFRRRCHFMQRLCKRAGIKPFSFHAIRHLTASILAREGIPMIMIQHILRHKNLATTERYLHSLLDLKQAISVLSKNEKPSPEPSTQVLDKESRRRSHDTAIILPFTGRSRRD